MSGLSKCLGSLQFTLWWISKCHTQVQGKSLNQYALRRDLLNIVVSWVQSPGPKCRFSHHQPEAQVCPQRFCLLLERLRLVSSAVWWWPPEAEIEKVVMTAAERRLSSSPGLTWWFQSVSRRHKAKNLRSLLISQLTSSPHCVCVCFHRA